MPTWKDVVAIAKTLPGAEVTTWYGTSGLKVDGKGFARLRTEAEGGLVLMCTLEEKEQLLESGEPAYYTTPHYDGFGSIIVNLAKVHRDALRDLMIQSWRMKASPRHRGAFVPAAGTAGTPAPASARTSASRTPAPRTPARSRVRTAAPRTPAPSKPRTK